MNDDVLEEQKYFLTIINQLKEMHAENSSVVRSLDFLADCVHNRMPDEEVEDED